jgi:hypothetical protein
MTVQQGNHGDGAPDGESRAARLWSRMVPWAVKLFVLVWLLMILGMVVMLILNLCGVISDACPACPTGVGYRGV